MGKTTLATKFLKILAEAESVAESETPPTAVILLFFGWREGEGGRKHGNLMIDLSVE